MKPLQKTPPLFALAIALAAQILLPNAETQPPATAPYFTYLLALLTALYAVLFGLSFLKPALDETLRYKAAFWTGAALALTALNALISKLALLPVLYFPAFDRVLGVLVLDAGLLAQCLAHSARLLFFGFFGGALFGLATGVAVGFSKRFSYWVMPLVRLVGPIPSTAWIPLVLILFPSAVSASAFLVGLAVWFPVTLMTSSGISNIPQSYFDAGATLGCAGFAKIFRIGVPAAAPHIFLGVFNGACASFITLFTAELIGARYGIGWYINWQKDMLSYANVYAGLLLIALCFFLLVTGLFKARDRVLGWQKGVIKW
jgi:NitT/TauT family transport system permease protein